MSFCWQQCSVRIMQKMCKKKIFQLQSMSSAVMCVDQSCVVKNIGASCLTSLFDYSNQEWVQLSVQVGKFLLFICPIFHL